MREQGGTAVAEQSANQDHQNETDAAAAAIAAACEPPGMRAPSLSPRSGEPPLAAIGGKDTPNFGMARPADPNGPLPRVLNQLERAPMGMTRFKVRVKAREYNNTVIHPNRYILVREGPDSEREARKFYLKVQELDRVENLQKDERGNFIVPELVVTRLDD